MVDHYETLGIRRNATADEIRSAYYQRIRDLNSLSPAEKGLSTREMLARIQDAFDTLSNPERRKIYDENQSLNPGETNPASLQIKFSRNVLPVSNEPQVVYATFDLLSRRDADPDRLAPYHLCLVIDRSTSMQGARIEMVKTTIKQLQSHFKPHDHLTVVAFSDRADVLIKNTPVSEVDFEALSEKLIPSGGTEIYQGLHTGYIQLLESEAFLLRQLVLLTDGHTYGDDGACLELAQQMVDKGISMCAMGIGHEWNDQLLDRIATLSGGNAMLISTPRDLANFLEEKLRSLNKVFASQCVMNLTPVDEVKLRYAIRMQPAPTILPLQPSIPLGPLEYKGAISLVLEFEVPPLAESTTAISLLKGEIHLSHFGEAEDLMKLDFDLNRPVAVQPAKETPPQMVTNAVSKVNLFLLQDKVRQEVSDGQIDSATRRLHYLATHLLTQGERELAHSVLLEAEHIQLSRRYSKEGDKRIKYGTRSLLMPLNAGRRE